MRPLSVTDFCDWLEALLGTPITMRHFPRAVSEKYFYLKNPISFPPNLVEKTSGIRAVRRQTSSVEGVNHLKYDLGWHTPSSYAFSTVVHS